MTVRAKLVAAACCAAVLSGCGLTKIETTRKDAFRFSPEVSTLTYDASRRGVFLVMRGGRTVICPEPPPDVAVQYAAAFGASLSASGKASGNIINPLGGAVTSVQETVTPSGLRDLIDTLVKDKKISLAKGPLTDTDLAKAIAEAGLSVSVSASQTQSPSQLGLSDAISLLRSSQFWACINQANSETYDAKYFDEHQKYIESMVHTLILAQYGQVINEAERSLLRSGLTAREAADEVQPLRDTLKNFEALKPPSMY